jgi:hypothetical protein
VSVIFYYLAFTHRVLVGTIPPRICRGSETFREKKWGDADRDKILPLRTAVKDDRH